MSDQNNITPALRYFFKTLERRSDALKNARNLEKLRFRDVPVDEIEQFFRAIKAQNIFINTVGVNGKRESTILSKAIFNLNKVVRVYYSSSFDDRQNGFILIQPDRENQTIVVIRMHGLRPRPELMYHSPDQMKIVRFMTRWLLRRIDWNKTKLNNLELYKHFVEVRKEENEARLREQIEGMVEDLSEGRVKSPSDTD